MMSSHFLERVIIICICVTLFVFAGGSEFDVIYILIAISIFSLTTYLNHRNISIIVFTGTVVLTVLFPAIAFFIPFPTYDIRYGKKNLLALLTLLPLVNLIATGNINAFFIVFSVTVLAYLLAAGQSTGDELKARNFELADQLRQIALNDSLQMHELMDKQDYELHLATMNERNRIARELHDSIGHVLTSAILQVGAISSVTDDPQTLDSLEVLSQSLTGGMDDVRTSIHNLYDQSVDLRAGLENQLSAFHHIPIDFKCQINEQPPRAVSIALSSILREGLSNMAKHSDATKATLIVYEHNDFYQFVLRDNGQACRTKSPDSLYNNGVGLSGMIQRVNALGGNINLSCHNGFEIHLTIPKESSHETNHHRR
ncbi:MAG: hypothetical protein GXY06_04520 [Clostridiaceae bacterium]|mgnify:CR=1 FL=1|nr:hypothetical protein [Clostridiaceae bacterium]